MADNIKKKQEEVNMVHGMNSSMKSITILILGKLEYKV